MFKISGNPCGTSINSPRGSGLSTTAALLLATLLAMPCTAAGVENDDDSTASRKAMVNFLDLNNQVKLNSPQGLALLGDEAKTWKVSTLGVLKTQPDKIIVIRPGQSVARVQWADKNRKTTDYYFFLHKTAGGQWLVDCCRDLASLGIVDEAHKKLAAKKNRNENENYQERNTALVCLNDADLTNWFKANKKKLDAICTAARSLPRPYPGTIKASDKNHTAIAKMIENLGLDSIALHSSGELQVIIGGVNKDFVGLLNAPGGKHPTISAKDWIWVEDMGENWFLFKHT